MAIGEKVAQARKRKGYSQEKLALDLPCSRESLAKYETGTRRLQDDLRKPISENVDDEELYFAMWSEATGHVSIPFFDGDYIDQHPTSMRYMVQRETNEALDKIEQVCWVKPIHMKNGNEREDMKRTIHELLDAAASMVNLVAILCREYDFSMKEVFKAWRVSVKARRWNK
ncbi:helix-turn-helix domain-containing protein [Schinkia azotoformans]|uniref:helix-turn-helix domain-containing protein n=1 Tax=Schinkia azotoformans TaxID=1454 RepID=UPI002DBFA2D7|nr:helix-turn-helix transcriptional regulator [Schinkia azotoformans]MEC1744154.1 helix-turn-helix transcriptional regulator [Schinkia azotoformans]